MESIVEVSNYLVKIFLVIGATVWFIGGIVCAVLTSKVAEAKGYNTVNWAWSGFLFGIAPLIALVGLPNKNKSERFTSSIDTNDKKLYQDYINNEPIICKWCRRNLSDQEIANIKLSMNKLQQDKNDWICPECQGKMLSGEWICPNCRVVNSNKLTKCHICNKSKP